MTRSETTRRQLLAARLKSAIAAAAIVGTIGGWVAFGTQAISATTNITTPIAAQTDVTSDTTTTTGAVASAAAPAASMSSDTTTQSSTAAQPATSTSSSSPQRGAVTTTRSSR